MDDLDVIRQFISDSDFSLEIKNALAECILIEFKGGATTEYNALLKKLVENTKNED